jgi:hypothetical protein
LTARGVVSTFSPAMRFTLSETDRLIDYLNRSKRRFIDDSATIYALKDGDEIVYVGKSESYTQMFVRIVYHARSGKIFDSWAYGFVDAQHLNKIEIMLIKKLNPKYNNAHAKKETGEPEWADWPMERKVRVALCDLLKRNPDFTFTVENLYNYMIGRFPGISLTWESVYHGFSRVKKEFNLRATNRTTRRGMRCHYTAIK